MRWSDSRVVAEHMLPSEMASAPAAQSRVGPAVALPPDGENGRPQCSRGATALPHPGRGGSMRTTVTLADARDEVRRSCGRTGGKQPATSVFVP